MNMKSLLFWRKKRYYDNAMVDPIEPIDLNKDKEIISLEELENRLETMKCDLYEMPGCLPSADTDEIIILKA